MGRGGGEPSSLGGKNQKKEDAWNLKGKNSALDLLNIKEKPASLLKWIFQRTSVPKRKYLSRKWIEIGVALFSCGQSIAPEVYYEGILHLMTERKSAESYKSEQQNKYDFLRVVFIIWITRIK